MAQQPQKSDLLVTTEAAYHALTYLVRRIWIIAAVFVATTAVSFFLLSRSPPTYQGEAILVLSQPFEQEAADVTTALIPKGLTVQDYQIILGTDSVLRKLRKEADWTDDDGNPVPLKSIRESTQVAAQIIKKTNIDIIHSPVLIMRATTDSGEEAARIANVWAEIAVEASKEYTSSSVEGLRDFFETRFTDTLEDYEGSLLSGTEDLDTVGARLESAVAARERDLGDFRIRKADALAALGRELRIQILETRLLSLGELVADQRAILEEAVVESEAMEAKAAELERDIESIPQTIALNRGLTDVAAGVLSAEGRSELLLSVAGEEVNPAHAEVRQSLSEARAEFAYAGRKNTALELRIEALERESGEVLAELEDAKAELAKLEATFAVEEAIIAAAHERTVETIAKLSEWTITRIDTELEQRGDTFTALSEKLLGARLAEAESQPDLKILVRAEPPTDPLPRGRAVKALSAGTSAAVSASLILLLIFGAGRLGTIFDDSKRKDA